MPKSGDCDLGSASILTLLSQFDLVHADPQEDGSVLMSKAFPHCLSYAGCSPYLRLSPIHDDCALADCTRLWIQVSDTLQVYGPKNQAVKAFCPVCETRQAVHFSTKEGWRCSCCEAAIPISALSLRKNVGTGRCFIHISPVFPNEARPTSYFLNLLQSHLSPKDEWRFFYHEISDLEDLRA